VLADDALQVQFASPLEQRDPGAINVIDVAERTIQRAGKMPNSRPLLNQADECLLCRLRSVRGVPHFASKVWLKVC
jgi:hypothetical protein